MSADGIEVTRQAAAVKPLRSATIVTVATIVALALSVITNVIAPTAMSKEAYGIWRAFVLYTGYAGLLHLGLVDASLIRWAGRRPEEVRDEVARAFTFFVIQQLVLTTAIAVVAAVVTSVDRRLIVAGAIAVIALNCFSFAQYLLQAFRSFRALASSTVAVQLVLLGGLLLFARAHVLSALDAVACTIASTAVAALLAAAPLRRLFRFHPSEIRRSFADGISLIGLGSFFLTGNLFATLFFGLDRLFATTLYAPQVFAAYAFPTTIVGSVYAMVTAVTTVAFPYLAARPDAVPAAFHLGKSLTFVAWGFALSLYFVVEMFVAAYLPAYRSSLPVLRIVLLAVGAGTVIRSTHYNIYRLTLRRVTYVLTSAISLGLFALMLLAFGKMVTMVQLAWLSVAATIIWFAINEASLVRQSLQSVTEALRQSMGAIAYGVTFWFVTQRISSPIAAMLAYVVGAVVMTTLFFLSDLRHTVRLLFKARRA